MHARDSYGVQGIDGVVFQSDFGVSLNLFPTKSAIPRRENIPTLDEEGNRVLDLHESVPKLWDSPLSTRAALTPIELFLAPGHKPETEALAKVMPITNKAAGSFLSQANNRL